MNLADSRSRYEVQAREVFNKFRTCINNPAVNALRDDYEVINTIYKNLQKAARRRISRP